ncbi:hypothetical protein [Yinghuangia soli]|uniref:Uncharacterized protein n=1 Tax=Yinghuangia soli TaxID=2908204 RepID=A0AA41PYL5_9ACTN|nr:hypothetical protein [Yinghuangia soli]MCF2528153.1 hypothetical protein [Yinghuangia soli]
MTRDIGGGLPGPGGGPRSGPAERARGYAQRWRPVAERPGEGWEVLPPLRWVVLGGATALVLLALMIAVAVLDG